MFWISKRESSMSFFETRIIGWIFLFISSTASIQSAAPMSSSMKFTTSDVSTQTT
jgi:hypothetical protein